MSNRSIYLISNARLGSSRLEQKMVKPLWDGTTLFELLLVRMNKLNKAFPFKGCAIALHENDKSLVRLAEQSGIDVILRSEKSVKSAALCDIYDYTELLGGDHFMWVNGSAPFWEPDTAARAARLFAASPHMESLTSVVKRKNWFWDYETSEAITCPDSGGATQDSKPILESTHSFHIFPKREVLDFNRYWGFFRQDPYLFEIDSSECVADVDNQEDFDVADALMMWRGLKRE